MKEKKVLCVPEIRKLNIASENMANKFLKELGLTTSQGIAISLLLDNSEKGRSVMTQRDLEQLMAMSNPAVAGIVSRLEAKGFVRRVKMGDDMRYNFLEPTEQSVALKETLYPHLLESEDKIFEGFSDDERALFLQFVTRMLENIAKGK